MAKQKQGRKDRATTEEKKITIPSNSNPKIEDIISDYPDNLCASPRGTFEEQLRKHLWKHKVQ